MGSADDGCFNSWFCVYEAINLVPTHFEERFNSGATFWSKGESKRITSSDRLCERTKVLANHTLVHPALKRG